MPINKKAAKARALRALLAFGLVFSLTIPNTLAFADSVKPKPVSISLRTEESTSTIPLGEFFDRVICVKNKGLINCFVKVRNPYLYVTGIGAGAEINWPYLLDCKGWQDGGDGCWYYTEPLPKGETATLRLQLDVPEVLNFPVNSSLTFINEELFAEAVQAEDYIPEIHDPVEPKEPAPESSLDAPEGQQGPSGKQGEIGSTMNPFKGDSSANLLERLGASDSSLAASGEGPWFNAFRDRALAKDSVSRQSQLGDVTQKDNENPAAALSAEPLLHRLEAEWDYVLEVTPPPYIALAAVIGLCVVLEVFAKRRRRNQ